MTKNNEINSFSKLDFTVKDSMDIRNMLTPIDYYPNNNSSEGNIAKDIGNNAYSFVTNLAEKIAAPPTTNTTQRYLPVQQALQKMKKDVDLLDDVAGRTPQLSGAELLVLISTVAISAISPAFLNMNVVEVLVPAMAALSASVGISAEYVGKVAISNGKEIAALAIQAAAEGEALLAQAERVKAILPLCVGISTTASAFALLAPSFANELLTKFNIKFITEIYLLSPLVAVLAAAIAGLATQESRGLASAAIGIGNRRFASSKSVGRTWMSAAEQVEASATRMTGKWTSFAIGVLPAPTIASIIPGDLQFKAIVCAAVAAAQAAYYLSTAEYFIACAVDAVALKSRAAAVADTYANQGGRAGSILPFTSALAGLCAAASAAVAEFLPLVSVWEVQGILAAVFPSGAALFAAAAAVSKARCEVDAAAASVAATEGIAGDSSKNYKDPLESLKQLIELTIKSTIVRIKARTMKIRRFFATLNYNKLKKMVYKKLGYWGA